MSSRQTECCVFDVLLMLMLVNRNCWTLTKVM